jgi:hypothetical protein
VGLSSKKHPFSSGARGSLTLHAGAGERLIFSRQESGTVIEKKSVASKQRLVLRVFAQARGFVFRLVFGFGEGFKNKTD